MKPLEPVLPAPTALCALQEVFHISVGLPPGLTLTQLVSSVMQATTVTAMLRLQSVLGTGPEPRLPPKYHVQLDTLARLRQSLIAQRLVVKAVSIKIQPV